MQNSLVELLVWCAGGNTPDPHRALFAAGDQCLGVHVLEFRDCAPEISSEFVPVPHPDMIYINHEARVSFLTLKEKQLKHVNTILVFLS